MPAWGLSPQGQKECLVYFNEMFPPGLALPSSCVTVRSHSESKGLLADEALFEIGRKLGEKLTHSFMQKLWSASLHSVAQIQEVYGRISLEISKINTGEDDKISTLTTIWTSGDGQDSAWEHLDMGVHEMSRTKSVTRGGGWVRVARVEVGYTPTMGLHVFVLERNQIHSRRTTREGERTAASELMCLGVTYTSLLVAETLPPDANLEVSMPSLRVSLVAADDGTKRLENYYTKYFTLQSFGRLGIATTLHDFGQVCGPPPPQ